MIELSVSKDQLNRLAASLGDKAHRLPRELQTAVNAVARKVASQTAKDLSKIMPLKQKTLKKIVRQKSKASTQSLRAVVQVGEGYPIPLLYFKPTQLKKGVTVKMRKGQSKYLIRDAFVVKQYGGRVYKRVGETRRPIKQQFGPKPGDYYAELGTQRKATQLAKEELAKQVERRIRFQVLKSTGAI
jgi:hypothetical protein